MVFACTGVLVYMHRCVCVCLCVCGGGGGGLMGVCVGVGVVGCVGVGVRVCVLSFCCKCISLSTSRRPRFHNFFILIKLNHGVIECQIQPVSRQTFS